MAALPLDSQTITNKSRQYYLQLCRDIFTSRDFSHVDQEICTAIKIMIGLEALNMEVPKFLPVISQQQILVTLNNICNIYNPLMGPTF